MYGRIGKLIAVPGRRDELARIILEGTRDMPGCLAYHVAKDATEPTAIWIHEVWTDREAHTASLGMETVREAMLRGRPLIRGMGDAIETEVVGGHGLDADADA